VRVLGPDQKRADEIAAQQQAMRFKFEAAGVWRAYGGVDWVKIAADPFDLERSYFLQASGLKGGRGAAGSNHSYGYGNLYGMIGGLSGKPGRGGDAGNIEIHLVNNSEDLNALRDDLMQGMALVEGGEPAQSHQQRTPSIAALAANRDRSAFKN